MTVVLALVFVGAFIYFPDTLNGQAMAAMTQKAATVADSAAFSVAPALQNHDRAAVAGALGGLRRNPDLVFFVLRDEKGLVFASFNEMVAESIGTAVAPRAEEPAAGPLLGGRPTGAPGETEGTFSRDGALYETRTPVRDHGKAIGALTIGFSMDRVQAETGRTRATIALVGLIAFAVAVLAVFFLSALITEPLRRMVKATQRIAAGDLDTRAELATDDEVGQLARSFNVMLDRLAEARTELESFSRMLEERVDERARALSFEMSQHRRSKVALRSSEERYRLLFDRNLAGVYIAAVDGSIIGCNDACAQLFRYDTQEEFLQQSGVISYMNPRDRDSIMRRLRADGAVMNEEVELRAKNGESVWALENVRLIPPQEDMGPTLEGILLNITDRKRAEEEIAYRAYHDSLTSLPNRSLFLDRLGLAVAHATRRKQQLAVMFLDLDDLKTINDTLGHGMGDNLLKMVAGRLRETLREEDTVARVGGDEFLVLLPEVESEKDAENVARKLLSAIRQPFLVEQDELHVTTSLGVAIFPRDGTTAETLMRNADGAMYSVKEAGGNGVEVCSRSGPRSVGRLALDEELREAIEGDQFVVWFQPQVTIENRQLVGVEALARWQHPERSLVDPAGFIPVAEHTGLIIALGEMILRKACEQGVRWQQQGYPPLRIAVNVSPRQLYQRDFVGMVKRIVAESGLDPRLLEIELTESVALQKSDRSVRILRRLRDLGIAIAVDDFGTGQSSLSYLKEFPVDTIKIDRSFVINVTRNPSDQSIVSAVLMVANELGLRTIAEGVETEGQCDFLRLRGCREIQGFLISRPLAADLLESTFLQGAAAAAEG